MTYQERRQWFRDRIGKTIWRNKTSCDCALCTIVYKEGLFVKDKMQADYCCDLVSDLNREGTPLQYFDTQEERDNFEQILKNGSGEDKEHH